MNIKKLYDDITEGNLTTGIVDDLLWKDAERIKTGKDKPQDLDSLLEMYSKWYLSKKSLIRIEDPTFLSFKIIIDWTSPLFRNNDKRVQVRKEKMGGGESLSYYLESVNQTWRKEKLLSFQGKMRELMTTRFHYMKSMDGLGSFWKIQPKVAFLPQEITISTIESMDMFISSMADDYLHATYDYQNMKNVAPINLRRFDMIVVIHEVRNIKSMLSNYFNGDEKYKKIMEEHGGESDRFIKDKDGMVFLNPYLGTHAYKFTDCEFDFSETFSYLSSVSNEGGKEVSTKFKISLGRMDFRYHDLDVFSESARKKRFLEEVEPHVYQRSEKQSEISREVRRFTTDGQKTSSSGIGDILKKVAIEEARKTSEAVTRAIDNQIKGTASHATKALKKKLDELETEFRPSNVAGRFANKQAKKAGDVAKRAIDKVDAGADTAISKLKAFMGDTGSAGNDSEQGAQAIKSHNDQFGTSKEETAKALKSIKESSEFEFPRRQEDDTREQLREIITENKSKFEYVRSVLEESMRQNG